VTRTVLCIALLSGVGLAAQATAPKPPDAKPTASTQTAASSAKTGSIDLTVTSQTGALLSDASVRADGPTTRQGATTSEGDLVLSNVAAGTYRCRIERDGYITLEKEIVVKTGARTAAEAVLSTAPPPPPPPAAPPAAPAPAPSTLVPGSPVTLSLVDQLAEDLMKSKDSIAEHGLGCSGATSANLIRLKDGLPSQTHADADELLYMITGEATLTIAGKDQAIGPGWLGLIPRGAAHAIARRGNKALLILSIQSGPVCPTSGAPGAQ
jgi:mannose-6-phosphate isomerase-like protein (cupin superfamily)